MTPPTPAIPRNLLRMTLIALLTTPGCTQYLTAQEPGVGRSRRARVEPQSIPPHPRLFVSAPDLPRLRQSIRLDPILAKWNAALIARGEKLLAEPPIEPPRGQNERILQKSRQARHRIADLAGIYLLNQDPRFANRAKEELLAATSFPDWNPSHFLDTAEMTFAVAVGYDWLYDQLSVRERKQVSDAIINLGLRPALNDYRRDVKWTRLETNWALVCNGGLVVGALAVADEDPRLSNQVLSEARPRLRKALAEFSPDGGYPEGPGYWNYATLYATCALAAAESAIGHAWDLENLPGFADTGLFRMHLIGPTGKQFNYSDAIEKPSNAPQMFYLATRFKRPAYADHEETYIMSEPIAGGAGKGAGPRLPPDNTQRELHIFHVLWHPQAIGNHAFDVPTDALFRAVDVAAFRSSWSDPDALYLAFKGGYNKAGHAHLDAGTFVLDALGVRWAVDLGPEDYDQSGYFRAEQRHQYPRVRTDGHNTLAINRENQRADARSPIIAHETTPARSHAVVDLTDAYPGARRVLRGVAMLDGRSVLIQDEIQLSRPAEIAWNMLTEADVRIDESGATLTQEGKSIRLQILSPRHAKFELQPLDLPSGSKQPTRAQKLTLVLANARETTIQIHISTAPNPSRGGNVPSQPLSRWSGRLAKR